jgi:hypothetical protein
MEIKAIEANKARDKAPVGGYILATVLGLIGFMALIAK